MSAYTWHPSTGELPLAMLLAAAMTDPRVMPERERQLLVDKLRQIRPLLAKNLEEERIDSYDTTIARLRAARDLKFARILIPSGKSPTLIDEDDGLVPVGWRSSVWLQNAGRA